MTQKLASYFNDYAEYHRTAGNQICHYIGIPLIVTTLLGLLSFITFGNSQWRTAVVRPDLGLILLFIGVTFYLYIDWKIALPFSLALLGMYFLGRSMSLPVLVGLQIVGWIIQLYGHKVYEKNSPAFLQNFTHTLIGPLWIFSKAVGYAKPEAS